MNNKLTPDQLIDKASKDSFPASDPPSFTAGKDKVSTPSDPNLKNNNIQERGHKSANNKNDELNQKPLSDIPGNIHDRPELQSDG